MRIALVVAVAKNGVIGARGALPWRISDDLKWFKKATLGKPVVMGRKTYDSIGKPLPRRDNIVVTRSDDWRAESITRAGSLAEGLRIASEFAISHGAGEICVIGGEEIFRAALPLADRIYLTRVEADVAGDAFFPRIDMTAWDETPAGICETGPKNEHACGFFVLDRRVIPD